MFVLLYADDTAIFSETPEGMQNALNVLMITVILGIFVLM